ncbi:cytidine deaminase-like protein [Melampsora americana]|nr:cytidine deaminase-like protein [Melampsora americana]
MLIALIGSRYAGKDTIAQHLVTQHAFKRVRITTSRCNETDSKEARLDELRFDDQDGFLDYSTKHWSQDLVTTELESKIDIEKFLKRPFFVLVNIEAPTRLRWERFDQNRSIQTKLPTGVPSNLQEFVLQDEAFEYGTRRDGEDDSVEDIGMGITRLGIPINVSQNHPPDHSSNMKLNLSNEETMRTPLKSIIPFASYTILNNSSLNDLLISIDQTHLQKLRNGLRPDWDQYFMTLANLASLRSNCMKRRVGAVLITKRDKRVLSTGYNGTPRGMNSLLKLANCNEGGCARCNGTLGSPDPQSSINSDMKAGSAAEVVSKCGMDLNECLCLHAEENALLEAGRDRMGAGEGSTLYCNTCPCLRCSVKIVQCGVREVVYSFSYSMDIGTAAVFAEAGVQLRQISLP